MVTFDERTAAMNPQAYGLDNIVLSEDGDENCQELRGTNDTTYVEGDPNGFLVVYVDLVNEQGHQSTGLD